MRRWLKAAIAAVTLGGVVAGAASSPRMLRRMESFRVRRLEISGIRYLQPEEVLRTSGITRQSSVFDDFQAWQRALENHSLVSRATLERKLPGTIVIRLIESEPIAYVAGPSGVLVAVNQAGEVLPLDPSRTGLDLPVITTAPGRARAAAISTLLLVKQHEPALYAWISDADAVAATVHVRLRSPAGAVALLPRDPDAARLRELRTTLADLAARQDLSRLIRIDARYRDQIVVALTPTAAT